MTYLVERPKIAIELQNPVPIYPAVTIIMDHLFLLPPAGADLRMVDPLLFE